MNYIEIQKIIEIKLNKKDNYVINDIKNIISIGSTGGEIDSMLGKYFKDLKTKDTSIYNIIENDILKFLSVCKKNGLEII